jgi:hypothetical protein
VAKRLGIPVDQGMADEAGGGSGEAANDNQHR